MLIFTLRKTDSTLSGSSEPFDKLPSDKAYDMVFELRLTEEQLTSNGYPRPADKPGTATIQCTKPMRRPNDTERYCSRCGKVFNLSMYEQECVDECIYHPKGTGYRRGKKPIVRVDVNHKHIFSFTLIRFQRQLPSLLSTTRWDTRLQLW